MVPPGALTWSCRTHQALVTTLASHAALLQMAIVPASLRVFGGTSPPTTTWPVGVKTIEASHKGDISRGGALQKGASHKGDIWQIVKWGRVALRLERWPVNRGGPGVKSTCQSRGTRGQVHLSIEGDQGSSPPVNRGGPGVKSTCQSRGTRGQVHLLLFQNFVNFVHPTLPVFRKRH